MEFDLSNSMGKILSIEGVFFHLLPISGLAAMERGSEFIEPIDLVKAIYIVDLEHVSMFWDDWRNYEAFVLRIGLADGKRAKYINRFSKILEWQLALRENPGQFVRLVPPSQALQEMALAAQRLARVRAGEDATPTSSDLLYCVCSLDPVLSESLQQAGLQLRELAADTKVSL